MYVQIAPEASSLFSFHLVYISIVECRFGIYNFKTKKTKKENRLKKNLSSRRPLNSLDYNCNSGS